MEQLSLLEQARLEVPDVTDEERIALLAARLIDELEATPPIKLEMVASWQGVERIELADLPCAGCLLTEAGQVVMKLRRGDPQGRRRFTGFHEVGHTFCPGFRLAPQYRCDPATPQARRGLEGLCDIAASELLFPRRLVTADLLGAAFGLNTVLALADRYEGSIEAAAHRFVSIWPEDVLMLVLEPGLRKEEVGRADTVPRLRVRTVHASGRWPYIPPNKSASDDGPLVRALNGEVIDERGSLKGLCKPIEGVEISARLVPYGRNGDQVDRVLALVRHPSARRGA